MNMTKPKSRTELEREVEQLRRRIAELEGEARREADVAPPASRSGFLHHVIDSLHHPFYVVDARDFTVCLANRAARFGDREGQSTCYALTHGRDEPCNGSEHRCPLEIVRRTKQPATVEHVHYDAEGHPRNVEVHAHPVFDDEGRVVQMIEYCLDITERKRQEEERRLIEARLGERHKLEAIGTLAGGVAHDMNNMLAAILGSATLLQREDLTPEARARLTGRIIDAAERGGSFTRNLLSFARRDQAVRERIDLATVVQPVVELLHRSGGKRVALDVELAPSLPPIEGDASQLSQVVMNLALNALHASRPGGRVLIEVHPVKLAGADGAGAPDLPAGPYVELRVSDEGAGMDSTTLERACEPFFTTKPAGEGTGLGLSMAYGTLRSHRGALVLTSEPGRGTTAVALLPALERAPDGSAGDSPGGRTDPPSSSGLILLVDDEPLVRSATEDLLISLGYRVLLAESGEAALELFERHRGQLDLVLLDLVMPGMGGAECFGQLRVMDERVPVLLCSGYSESDLVERLLSSGARGFLAKPFDLDRLAAALVDALRVAT